MSNFCIHLGDLYLNNRIYFGSDWRVKLCWLLMRLSAIVMQLDILYYKAEDVDGSVLMQTSNVMEPWNNRTAWVRRDNKNHQVPTSLL